jgi:DNA (cytosine-5)-methyltransferase 1
MGYARAGFEVVGVDIKPQPRYPFEFHQADAMDPVHWFRFSRSFDAIHASPPCQAFSSLRWMHNAKENPDLIDATRQRLIDACVPYIIENVAGARLNAMIRLCGSSFGLGYENAELRRHRYFETSFPLLAPPCHHKAERVIGVYGGHGRDRRRKVNTQDYSTEARRQAMGIDWMTGAELSEAIPPAYTQWIGEHLMAALKVPAMREPALALEAPE